MNIRNLTIGDKLTRIKGNDLTKDYALYAGIIKGRLSVAEKTKEKGVFYTPLIEYINKGKQVRVEYNNFCKDKQEIIIKNINKQIRKKNDSKQYNCEQFVNEIIEDKKDNRIILLKKFAKVASLIILIFIGQKIQNNG